MLNCPTKPKGVTTQMKALEQWVLSNDGVHIVDEQTSCFCSFYVLFGQRNMAVKGLRFLILFEQWDFGFPVISLAK